MLSAAPSSIKRTCLLCHFLLLVLVAQIANGQQYTQQAGQQYQQRPPQQQYQQPNQPQGTQQQNRAVQGRPVGFQQPANQNGNQAGNQQPGYAGAAVQPQGQRIPVVQPGQAVQAGNAKVAQAKQPFPPLKPQEQQFLDTVLNVWQKKTAAVAQYECNFTRWQYDPTINTEAPATIATGDVKYMKPDKGLFKVAEIKFAQGQGPKPEYAINPRQPAGEHWICDGDWIHSLDANEKKAVRTQLPPDMAGALIHRSPLPFLFGVNAQEIKNRYWIRPIIPAPDEDVWLEAWPKWADDAGNYSRVQIVLSRQDTLPRGLIVFLPNFRADQPHREIYEFKNRKVPKGLLNSIKQKVFMQQFIPTTLPAGWEVNEIPYEAPEQQRVAQPNGAQPVTR